MNPFYFMLVPALVALGGGILALIWHPSREMRSLIQHFAAGVVLAALAVELFPELSREHAPGRVLLSSFAAGTLLMYLLKLWATHQEAKSHALAQSHPNEPAIDSGLIAATFIDIAVDGFIIGAGFAAGGETGPILAIGLSVELLFLGLSLTSDYLKGWRIVAISAALGATVLVFAYLGNWLLAGASTVVIAAALAASAAALLYLVTEELLIEAHEVEEKPFYMLVLFAGFLLFWAIQLLGVH
ncbi:MAG: zinc permease [Thiofilum sp.]|uniref:zinc permease n=1 Tax=Thiofilum sp. TaxID=2212733 RepID=UPI0025EB9185|nr:zinc permease [Thiofilum sp.]MBK8453954.1 zinc permease [Thiofilum sp.]